jgi:hypothetical protein
MYLCYIDESGTPEIPGNTSHYVLSGLTIPIDKWKQCDIQISNIKKKFNLENAEIHTGWILRKYLEQSKIPNFEKLSYSDRKYEVEKQRHTTLLNLQKTNKANLYKQTKKNYIKTNPYIHLTYDERMNFIREIASTISSWTFARLFAECIDKIFFNPSATPVSIDEQALEQIITRFEYFLKNLDKSTHGKTFGLLIHDNNDTVARKHTLLMKKFHNHGTFWVDIDHLIETPLFVNSELTGMIQLSDVCCYALRRYLENNESDLFEKIFDRGDRKNGACVGIRHFSSTACSCIICKSHKKKQKNCT